MINIGCGRIYHSDWINLDIASDNPSVLKVDITKGLPFTSSSVTACYSSHVLEHMDRSSARFMLDECFRVLMSGGILRLAVPDLEVIAREYLTILDQLVSGDTTRAQDYDWIILEMYDQVSRNRSGGEMLEFLSQLEPTARKYVTSRIGSEADYIWERLNVKSKPKLSVKNILAWRRCLNRIRFLIAKKLVWLVAGKQAQLNFEHGMFRGGGEIHQHMYDRYSLKLLLEQVGFTSIKICRANESSIPKFTSYDLDSTDGKARKPDSLFIEAIKP